MKKALLGKSKLFRPFACIILSSILCPLWTLFLTISVAPALSSLKYNETIKDQLISKCLLSVFTFFQKTDKNKSTNSNVAFVFSFFLEETSAWRNQFGFVWPLEGYLVLVPYFISFCLFKQAKTQEDTSWEMKGNGNMS